MSLLLILLFSLIALNFGINVVGTAIGFYERRELLFPEVLPPKHIPWPLRLSSIFRETAAQTLFRLLWPLGLLPEQLPTAMIEAPGQSAHTDDIQTPVLLIHGYAHNRFIMSPLKFWLKKKGFTPLTFDHRAGGDSIENRAHRLARRVDILKKLTGSDTITLVAHSMGGLVARYYIEQLGGASSVDHLITLGTPHQGTGLSVFARGAVAAQLLPGSSLLESLDRSLNQPNQPKYTAIAGELDTVVFPLERALLPAPHNNTVLKGLGHNSLLLHGRAFSAIRTALAPETVLTVELTTQPRELHSENALTLDTLLKTEPSTLENELLGEKITSI